MRRIAEVVFMIAGCLFAAYAARSQELRIPEQVVAGKGTTISTSGSGDASFYLVGPGTALKRRVKLGEDVTLEPEQLRAAGRYVAVLRGGNSVSRAFFVTPAEPARIAFLARPSRVPVDRKGVISGVAFVFDEYRNLVLAPASVNFELKLADAAPLGRSVQAANGIAWVKLDSGRRAGAAQFVAAVNGASVRRVVQQTASDPCNLRFRAQPDKLGVLLETDPVRDCAGNPVPDGTIVTFTASDGQRRSTVDARIKRGVARAQLPAMPGATITVASGVVLGNEIRWGGGQ